MAMKMELNGDEKKVFEFFVSAVIPSKGFWKFTYNMAGVLCESPWT